MTARGPFFMLLAALSAPAGEDPAIRVGRLGDPDAAVRDAAFRDLVVLAEREPRAVLRALPEAHDDPEVMIRCRELRERIRSSTVRAEAIALAKGDGKLTAALSAFFDGPATGSTVAALYRDLGERAPRFRGVSLYLLDHAEPAVRLAAVRGVAETAGIRGAHLVLSRADDPDPSVRRLAVRMAAAILDPATSVAMIGRFPVEENGWPELLGAEGTDAAPSPAAARLMGVYRREPRREARARALVALGYMEDPALAAWLKGVSGREENALLAGMAAYAAAFAAGDRESAWFAGLLDAGDPFLATAGALALCHIAGEEASPSFRRFAEALDPMSLLEMAMGLQELSQEPGDLSARMGREAPEPGAALPWWPAQPALMKEARAWLVTRRQ